MRDDSAGNHARKDIFGREKLFVVGLRAAKSAKTKKKKIQKKRNKQKEKQERSWFAVGRSKLFHRASFPFLFVVPNFSFFLVFFSLSFFLLLVPKKNFARKERRKSKGKKSVATSYYRPMELEIGRVRRAFVSAYVRVRKRPFSRTD